MLRNIYLHGRLAEKFGDVFQFDVATAGEAIRALQCNFNTFADELKVGSYELIRGEIDAAKGLWLGLDDVNEFKLGNADFHIIPVIEGGKGSHTGAILKIVIGIALVGAVLFTGGIAAIGAGGFYGNVAMIGFGLAVAGVASLLTPKAQNPNQQNSFLVSSPGNTYDQGNPVPLVYGDCICGSQLISSGMTIEPIPVNWDPTKGNTLFGTYNPETGEGVQTGDPSTYTSPSGLT